MELKSIMQVMRVLTNDTGYNASQEFLARMETHKTPSPKVHTLCKFNMNLPCRSSYRLNRIRGFNMNLRCKSSLPYSAMAEYQKERRVNALIGNSTGQISSRSVTRSSVNTEVSSTPSSLPRKLYNIDQTLDGYHRSAYTWLHANKQPTQPHEVHNWRTQIVRVFQNLRSG